MRNVAELLAQLAGAARAAGVTELELRERFAVTVGDGGHEPLLRRMRAQANFVENAPFVLILIGGLEVSGANRLALASIAAIFILARIAHPIGMDAAENRRWRMVGMAGNMFVTLALSMWALICVGEALLGR